MRFFSPFTARPRPIAPVRKRPLVVGLAIVTTLVIAALVALIGPFSSRAVQDPSISLDMVTTGNAYDGATNSMSVGTIDDCLSEAANNNAHNVQAHLIVQNVEDIAGAQVRINHDDTKLEVTNVLWTPFSDPNTLSPVGFLNLPFDPVASDHRALTGASDFSAPNTSLAAASYLGDQTPPVSSDSPAKTAPDDTSYSAPTGGILATVVINVKAGQQGQPSLAIDLDDDNPIAPGSSVDILGGSGIVKRNLEGFRLGDGFIGNGVTCVPSPAESPPAATLTPTPCAYCTPTPTATPREGGVFNPQVSQTYSTTDPGSHPDIVGQFNIGLGPDGAVLTPDDTGDYNFGGVLDLTPTSPRDADIPDGAILGELKAIAVLGVLNNPCNRRVDIDTLPAKFVFMEATTDNNNLAFSEPWGPTEPLGNNDLARIAGDTSPSPDGIQDIKPPPVVTRYPAFLNAIFDPDWVDFGPDHIAGNADDNNGPQPPIKPIFRQAAVTSIGFAGNLWVILQTVVFERGTKLPQLPFVDAGYGYPSVTVLQTASAAGSATGVAPSAITDFCTPLKVDFVSYGETHDNPDTPANEGGLPTRTLPDSGDVTTIGYYQSLRDADGDGFENSLDTCPFNFDAEWNPHSLTNPAPGDIDVVAGLMTGDGIPNTCDPTPDEPSGIQPTDHDDDGFPNSGDNCPLHYNPDQSDTDVNEAGEIIGDGIGDACDTPGTDSGNDSAGRPIPPRSVAGNGPGVPDGEQLLCVRLQTITVGGPHEATVSDCLDSLPPIIPPGPTSTPSPSYGPGSYRPLSARRILDTRSGPGPIGKIGADGTLIVDVTGVGGVPASGVSAVVLNVTVTEPTAASFLTVFQPPIALPLTTVPLPSTSNVNFTEGQTIANLVIVPVGADGNVWVYNKAGSVHVIVDVAGWYTGP